MKTLFFLIMIALIPVEVNASNWAFCILTDSLSDKGNSHRVAMVKLFKTEVNRSMDLDLKGMVQKFKFHDIGKPPYHSCILKVGASKQTMTERYNAQVKRLKNGAWTKSFTIVEWKE